MKTRKHTHDGVKIKKKRKLKKLTVILTIVLLVCLGALGYAAINIGGWFKDSKETKKVEERIESEVKVEEIPQEEEKKVEVQTVKQKEKIDEANPYWDYMKMSLINVDLSKLEKTNSDTVGWIQVNGTNVNYPFVQTTNNEYYLKHSIEKKYNGAGWIFLDYRNNLDKISSVSDVDRNTILYGHARYEGTMFGSLKKVLTKTWYNNTNNHILKLATGKQSTLWQIFSIYHVPETSDYIQVNFKDDAAFKTFVDMLQKRSVYKFNTTVSGTDKILTLSTCYGTNDQERLVVHAKLIKYTDKIN